MTSSFKKDWYKIRIINWYWYAINVEKGIRGAICQAIHRYTKANKKYMKNYDKNKESSYLRYWDVNNLYGWAVLQKLPANKFEWIKDTSKFNEDFIKNYNEESDEGYFIKVNIQYLENYMNFSKYFPFLPEKITIEKFEKPDTNLHDETEYAIQIRNLKQALNHGLIFKKPHRLIKLKQND